MQVNNGDIEKIVMQYLYNRHQPKFLMAGVGAINIILISIGIVFLSIASYSWLNNFFENYISALIISGSLMLVSLTSFIITKSYINKKEREAKVNKQKNITSLVETLAAEYSDEIIDIVKDNPKASLFTSAVIGYFASNKI